MEIRLFFAICSAVIATFGFYQYIRDILKRKTEPHLYTWLIWLITASIATAGVYVGGGGYTFFNMLLGTVSVLVVVALSIRYGSKNITVSDTIVLISALGAIVVWWQFENALLAVLMATAIDVIGYIPTYRKAYSKPYTETVSAWMWFAVAPACGLAALAEYNALTTTYLAVIIVANILVVAICVLRRRIF